MGNTMLRENRQAAACFLSSTIPYRSTQISTVWAMHATTVRTIPTTCNTTLMTTALAMCAIIVPRPLMTTRSTMMQMRQAMCVTIARKSPIPYSMIVTATELVIAVISSQPVTMIRIVKNGAPWKPCVVWEWLPLWR